MAATIEDLDLKIGLLIQSVDGLKERIAEQREELIRQSDEHARRIGQLEQAKAQTDVAMAGMQGQITAAVNTSSGLETVIRQAADALVAALASAKASPNWTAVAPAVVAIITVSAYVVEKIVS